MSVSSVAPLRACHSLSGSFRKPAVGLLALAALSSSAALARDFAIGALTVEQPWSRATPGGAKVAIGCLVIRNAGDSPDRLTSVTTEISAEATPHTMSMKDGVMVMRPIVGGVVIPARGTVTFRPGSDHLMLEGLKHPLRKGDHFTGSLTFEKAGTLPVVFDVESIGAQAPAGQGGKPMTMPMDMN